MIAAVKSPRNEDSDSIRWLIEPSRHNAASFAELVETIHLFAREDANGASGSWALEKPHSWRMVFRHSKGTRQLFCKLFRPKLKWHLRNGLRIWPTPAKRAVRWFRELERIGVATVHLVGAGELRGMEQGPWQTPSFVITESDSQMRTLADIANDDSIGPEDRMFLANNIETIAKKLHAAGVGGIDFKAENLLFDRQSRSVLLFDVDRLVRLRGPYRQRRIRRDLAKVERTKQRLLQGLDPLAPSQHETRDLISRKRYQDQRFASRYDFLRFSEDAKKQRRDLQTRKAIEQALSRLEETTRILDLPCGTGRLTEMVSDSGFTYIGADLSAAMLSIARDKTNERDSRFMRSDARALPFADRSLDCVLCVRFLNLVEGTTRQKILEEMRRVSSRYLVVASGYFGPMDPWRTMIGKLYPKLGKRMKLTAELHRDLAATGWRSHTWIPYKSSGFFSTTKNIAIFERTDQISGAE